MSRFLSIWPQFSPLVTAALILFSVFPVDARAAKPAESPRVYRNTLTRLSNPTPLLNDHPEFVQPVIEQTRYEAPILVDQENADLSVRAWRFSYNARGIIEMPNRLCAKQTAVIMVHPVGNWTMVRDGRRRSQPELQISVRRQKTILPKSTSVKW